MKRIESCMTECGPELANILEMAGKAALRAGKILRELYGKPHQIRYKGDIDLVTEADISSESAIIAMLNKARLHAEILAEESRSTYNEMPTGPVWIMDPLDGTTNFVHGFPWFAVSIAYAEKGRSHVGVIYCPMQDELFCGCLNNGAWLNGKPIKVSGIPVLDKSLLATGFPYDVRQKPAKVMSALEAVLIRSQGVRRAGAAALDLAYVACGRLDGFWEIKLKPWDTAAGQLLLEEAGGKISDFRGGSYSPFIPEILAMNSLIHEELLSIIKNVL
ncbi:MAG: inositol monophosphatase [Deltaproteobacteria bacterium]|nr:inositol monophosphatase [Deltaproteobacteria bacterium]MDL1960191.1 inositol monophosphatase [Deltaproteobacteria bacterium]